MQTQGEHANSIQWPGWNQFFVFSHQYYNETVLNEIMLFQDLLYYLIKYVYLGLFLSCSILFIYLPLKQNSVSSSEEC